MARKRKSRNNSKIGHGAISRIGRPNNPFEPRRNRYAQKYLTLALMGRDEERIAKSAHALGN